MKTVPHIVAERHMSPACCGTVWRRLCVLVIFILLVPTVARAQWHVSYEAGVNSFKSGSWSQAVQQLSAAIAARPEASLSVRLDETRTIDYFPYLYRGAAYYELGENDNALGDLQRARDDGLVVRSNDETAKAVLRKYLSFVEAKRSAAPPGNAFAEAVRLFEAGMLEEARMAFLRIEPSDVSYEEARDYLRFIDEELERVRTQDAFLEKQGRIARTFSSAEELFNLGEYDEAEERFNQVLILDPNHAEAEDFLARIRSMRRSEGERKARQARIAQLLGEGESLFRAGNLAEAEGKFLAILALDNNNAQATGWLQRISSSRSTEETSRKVESLVAEGRSFFARGDLKNAKDRFSGAQGLDTSRADIAEYLRRIANLERKIREGTRSYLTGDYERAIQTLDEVARETPPGDHVLAILACSYAAQYLLRGEDDRDLRVKALGAYKRLMSVNSAYQFDKRYVSPRIVNILSP